MKTQLWVYIVVAVLGLGAGVAIAGVPTFEEREATIEVPVASSDEADSDVDAALSESSDAVGDSSNDVAADAEETPETEAGESVEETTTTSTSTTTTTTTTVPLIERTSLDMVAANGANVGGAASRASNALEAAGYVDVVSADGTEVVDRTVIYAADGLQGEAERLAEDIGIESNLIFPLIGAPGLDSLPSPVQVVVYLGRDVVDLDFFN